MNSTNSSPQNVKEMFSFTWIPPRSSLPAMPSTSSMIRTCLLLTVCDVPAKHKRKKMDEYHLLISRLYVMLILTGEFIRCVQHAVHLWEVLLNWKYDHVRGTGVTFVEVLYAGVVQRLGDDFLQAVFAASTAGIHLHITEAQLLQDDTQTSGGWDQSRALNMQRNCSE